MSGYGLARLAFFIFHLLLIGNQNRSGTKIYLAWLRFVAGLIKTGNSFFFSFNRSFFCTNITAAQTQLKRIEN